MGEGKTGKPAMPAGRYMKYAIGEILLVMIGILLALQVNNWNENRNKEKLEIQFLNRLVEDLTIDTAYYNYRSERSMSVVNKHRELIQLMYQTQESVEDVKDIYRRIRWATEDLTIQNSGFTELTNSGNLNIINNQELKNAIIYYYRECEKTARGIAEFDEVSTRHLIHLGQVTPNHVKFNSNHEDIFKDLPVYIEDWDYFNDPSSVKFQTLTFALSIYKLKHAGYLDDYEKLKNMSSQLIKDIHKELESRK